MECDYGWTKKNQLHLQKSHKKKNGEPKRYCWERRRRIVQKFKTKCPMLKYLPCKMNRDTQWAAGLQVGQMNTDDYIDPDATHLDQKELCPTKCSHIISKH